METLGGWITHADWRLLLAAAVVLFALIAWLGAWLAEAWRSFLTRRRFARGRQGELEAEEWLKDNGFTILETQSKKTVELFVDGKHQTVEVIADIIALKDGKRYLFEVKTGEKAVDPLYRTTRRQLLEYQLAFEPDHLMLLNMETGNAHRIEFPSVAGTAVIPWKYWAKRYLISGAVGAFIGALLTALIVCLR